jgi:hypothetical protein
MQCWRSNVRNTLMALFAGLLACALAVGAAEPVARLDAYALNMGTVGRKGGKMVQVTIERWSTDEERDALRDALIEKGPGALMDALQKIKPRAGFINESGRLGWDIQFARQQDLPSGGRRIIFATDRPMSFGELSNQTRSSDYDFMLCEIRLTPDGKGVGKLAVAAKISWNRDTRTVEIENYSSEPVRLESVQDRTPKPKTK